MRSLNEIEADIKRVKLELFYIDCFSKFNTELERELDDLTEEYENTYAILEKYDCL